MLISPPFLPARGAAESEDAWIERCMSGGLPGQGAFPVSFNLGWHGGMHLTAPANGNQWEPVRAIADGEVVFVRQPTPMPAGELPPTDAQAYGGSWTDNGVVVIRHSTEIGEGADAAVTFFSITMHLNHIEAAIQPRQQVYRKAALGTAGRIAGRSVGEAFLHTVHLEIVCDDANVERLTGRANGDLNTAADGRTNAVFGEMYFHLPSGAQVFGQQPLPDNPQAMMQPPTPRGQRAPAAQPLQPIHTTNEELFVGLRYAGGEGAVGHRGDAAITTYRPDGSEVGAALTEDDAEYTLYTTATAISEAYPAANRPAPSAVFELLRFGRVIGPDALAPADVPHWRQVSYDGGQGWVNLNAASVHKFSDADFPHWKQWSLIDDSADGNSRCDSTVIRGWLDSDGNGTVTAAEAQSRMADNTVAPKLAHAICKFPTEWNAATIDTRWGWLKTQSDENPLPLPDEDFEALRRHITALAFWPGNMPIDANHWHWQPREFIRQFRKCGWLSQEELVQCIPRNSPAGQVPLTTARARIRTWGTSINNMARKFSLDGRGRMAHLLGHVWAETGYLRLTREAGADGARYAPYIGRGLIQITWQDKYENYNDFARITPNGGSNFNLELIATDPYHAGNSSGFYWVSKDYFEPRDVSTSNLSRIADEGNGTDSIGRLCLWINGGGNHYDHRHIHLFFIERLLDDVGRTPPAAFPIVVQRSFRRMEFVRETRTINGHQVRKIVGTQQSASSLTISIDFTPQR